MTGNPMTPRQKRLYNCLLHEPQSPKIRENLQSCAFDTLKAPVFGGDAAVSIENTGENRQARYNTKLLGK